ncbi:MAG: hypothetical protein FJW34_11015 [Acidobacteria bacterium]|nr:hypothetical protein [Acidobacteriota bacterium]
MAARAVLWLAGVAAVSSAQVIDRIAVTVDQQVITHSRVLEEIRLAAFQNREPLDFSAAARRGAAERLVERLLIEREMELTRFPAPPASEAARAIEELKRERPERPFAEALAAYDISQEALQKFLLNQAGVLRFLEGRFRPQVQVSETEVRACYQKREPKTTSALEQARAECEAALTAAGVDQEVDRWLREVRGRVRLVYREEAFR